MGFECCIACSYVLVQPGYLEFTSFHYFKFGFLFDSDSDSLVYLNILDFPLVKVGIFMYLLVKFVCRILYIELVVTYKKDGGFWVVG